MVTTFYAAQARRLQERLQAERPDVLVMTVDSAQGSETDYVILSCVRCNDGHNIGRFVADPRRVNVAMSRARKQLIVVGSSKTLVRTCSGSQHDLWSSFKKRTDALLDPPLLAQSSVAEASVQEHSSSETGSREPIKTKLCRYYSTPNWCQKGDACTFAHGDAQLRPGSRGPFKTTLCRFFSTPNGCQHGDACTFAHGDAQLLSGRC